MTTGPAITVDSLSHDYGSRRALDSLSLQIERGQIFALLGPNGSGKTTLFRILSTLLAPQSGQAKVLGHDLATAAAQVRAVIGVVFQAPGLDKKLTVRENLRTQAALYGIGGQLLRDRERQLLEQFAVADRASELTEKLSGGLRRRVELAKGMIHQPAVLLLDEPSTGVDPTARLDLWNYLTHLRDEHGVTIVLTTHLFEEAEKADRVAILHQGRLVALDAPDALRSSVGGDSLTIESESPDVLARGMREQFELQPILLDGTVRLELPDAHQWIARLVEAFPGQIGSIRLGKPTLEDVFIDKTGHRFLHDSEQPVER